MNEKMKQEKEKNLLWISITSFCWSSSTIMIFSVLPIYLTKVLNVSKTSLGLMEGFAISLSFLSKIFSGVASDFFKTRKHFIVIGTVLTVLIRPFFIFANNGLAIFWARFIDRFGKGVRSAPTDALVADMAKEKERGSGFGLRQALYTLGSVFGSFLTIFIMKETGGAYKTLFAIAFVIAFISLLILIFKVKDSNEEAIKESEKKFHKEFKWSYLKSFPLSFWFFMVVVFFIMMTRFSEMFLNLRAHDLGLSIEYIPFIIITMDLVHALIAYPFGKLSDRFNPYSFLLFTLIFLVISDFFFAFSSNLIFYWGGLISLGIHMGASQGLLRAITVRSIPYELRGTAFAVFYFFSGVAIFLTNAIVGVLADRFGNYSPFIFGGSFGILSIILVLFFLNNKTQTFKN